MRLAKGWYGQNLSLYTNNKQSKREIKKIIPFTIASRRIKYLGISQTKELKDFYSEKK
jgi:hypothetical protein